MATTKENINENHEQDWLGLSLVIFIVHMTNITVMFTPFSGPLSIVKYVIFAMSYLLLLIVMWKGTTEEFKDHKYVIYTSTILYLIVWMIVIYFSEDSLNKFIKNMTSSLKLD